MAYRQKVINFGRGTGSAQNSTYKKDPEWTTNEAGHDVKRTTRKNLFGRERVVEKYFDPETGEKLGKQVRVARGKGEPRADKVKTKRTNRGWTAEGGVGKIRVDDDYFGGPAKDTPPTDTPTNNEKINREERADDLNDPNVTRDPDTGKPDIPKYEAAYNEFEEVDGKKINPRTGAEYSSLSEFEDDDEGWWDEQAEKTDNKKLEEQDQDYAREYTSSNTYKKRGYTMKRKRK